MIGSIFVVPFMVPFVVPASTTLDEYLIPTTKQSPTMPEKRKSRDYYSDCKVAVGDVLERYPAIKEVFQDDHVLMSSLIRVPDNIFHQLNNTRKK